MPSLGNNERRENTEPNMQLGRTRHVLALRLIRAAVFSMCVTKQDFVVLAMPIPAQPTTRNL